MKKLTIMLSAMAIAAGTFAEEIDDVERKPTPIDLGLMMGLKLPPYERDVWGLKLNILHSHELNVYGLDTGFIGCNTGDAAGLQANVFNWVDGAAYGVQIGGVGNYVTGDFYGLQIGGLLSYNLGETYGAQLSLLNFDTAFCGLEVGGLNWNYAGMTGIQLGVVDVERHDVTGAQVGAFNFCRGNVTGGQIGVFNFVNGTGHGFQLGLVNAAQRFYGVQVGLVNVNIFGRLPIMVIANANF